jgi:CRP-like cAMP-binding protein
MRVVARAEDKAGEGAPWVANGILKQLSEGCRAEILARSEIVLLNRRQILLERNLPLRFAYFVEGGIMSLFARAGTDRAHVEIGTLGVGDFIGIPIVLGAKNSPYRCVVQVQGSALRIEVDVLTALLESFPDLRRALLAYIHAAIVRSSQLLACNARHSLRERLARWLLVTSDRLQMSQIPLTHDVMSRAIAVRRAGVTTEMGRMEEAGLIRRMRGSILILDPEGLVSVSCSCYRQLCLTAKMCDTGPIFDAPPH